MNNGFIKWLEEQRYEYIRFDSEKTKGSEWMILDVYHSLFVNRGYDLKTVQLYYTGYGFKMICNG
jgi:hypothetical protein